MTIFLTVGLHEQPFDRLVRAVDELYGNDAVIQYGYSDYLPQHARGEKTFSFDETRELMEQADVVITHGGTGSIVLALSVGKKPVVAPRYQHLGEHVDDHQLEIVNELGARNLVVPLLEGDDLATAVSAAGQASIEQGDRTERRIVGTLVDYLERECVR